MKDLQIAQTLPHCFELSTVMPKTWQRLIQINSVDCARLAEVRSKLRQAELQLCQTSQPTLYLECLMLDLIATPTSGATAKPNHNSLDLAITWQHTLNQLSVNHRPVFRQAQLIQCTSDGATIRFRAATFLNLATNYQSTIEQALSQALGYRVPVRLCA
jgi:hypothetical protein